jgi:hypothetical protein
MSYTVRHLSDDGTVQFGGGTPSIDAAADEVTNRLGLNAECPMCHRAEWVRFTPGHLAEVPLVRHPKPRYATPNHLSAVGFVCVGCGFTRLHAVDVRAWTGRPPDSS